MLQKMHRSIVLFWKAGTFLLLAAVFFLLFSIKTPFLLRPSRTSGITLLAFFLTYVLMTRVYGGLDIGKKKSRPIIYALSLCVIAADLVADLFLSIMNTTVIHNGRFVFEQPLLLLLVSALQIVLIMLLTYAGNAFYFHFVQRQQRCLVIAHPGDDIEALTRKISAYHRQFKISQIVTLDHPNLFSLIDAYDCVFICNLSVSERLEIVEYCYSQKKNFYHTLEMADLVSLGSERVMFDDISMMHSASKGLTMEQRIVKRLSDLVLASLALILVSPIMLVTAIAIKLEDGGHVFYLQDRATYGGRTFQVIKFRSMREENSVNRSVTKDDDRITKVGRVIRKYRIDELPQLINVLRSDMSLVGPRPEMLENVKKYTQQLPEFSYRLWAKAGLTGMAQIYGKYNTSPKEKLTMDLIYIEQYSLILDLKLLLRTILVFFTPEESTEAFDKEELPK